MSGQIELLIQYIRVRQVQWGLAVQTWSPAYLLPQLGRSHVVCVKSLHPQSLFLDSVDDLRGLGGGRHFLMTSVHNTPLETILESCLKPHAHVLVFITEVINISLKTV